MWNISSGTTLSKFRLTYYFITNDGMIFGIQNDNNTRTNVEIIADINGIKNPNTGTKDLCLYTISNGGTLTEQCASMDYASTDGFYYDSATGSYVKCSSNATKCNASGVLECAEGHTLTNGRCI